MEHSHEWREQQEESEHAREDGARSHDHACLFNELVALLQHGSSVGLVFLDAVNNFFEEHAHAAVHTLANVADPAAATVLVNVGGGRGGPVDLFLERVPLSEGKEVLFARILDELCAQRNLAAGSVIHFHSVGSNMARIINCLTATRTGAVQKVADGLELQELGLGHAFLSLVENFLESVRLLVGPLFCLDILVANS